MEGRRGRRSPARSRSTARCWRSPPSSCSARSCRSSTRRSSTSRSTTCRRDFDAPLPTIQWVSTGYLLALATVIPLTGWAADRFGTKRLYMTSLVLFLAGSALSALAWSAQSLIAFRVLQGLGGGMIMPAGMTILTQAAGPQRVGRVMSVVGVADADRADPRPGARRLARRRRLVALDLLREHPDRRVALAAGLPHPQPDKPQPRAPARPGRPARCCRRAWRCSSTGSRRPARTAASTARRSSCRRSPASR